MGLDSGKFQYFIWNVGLSSGRILAGRKASSSKHLHALAIPAPWQCPHHLTVHLLQLSRASNAGRRQGAQLHILAPGDDMGACDHTQRRRIFQAAERNKLRHILFIEAPRLGIGDVGKPFDFWGHIGEGAILLLRKCTFAIDTD